MSLVCNIPGASSAVSVWHFALELGLAAFVVGAGLVFLVSALRAYRRPLVVRQGDERDATA